MFQKQNYRQPFRALILILFMAAYIDASAQPLKALNMGQTEQQHDSLMPRSRAPIQQPVLKPKMAAITELIPAGDGLYNVRNGWELAEEQKVIGSPVSVFSAQLNTATWYNATVPGTVLTTLVDRGVYPDPYFGLNNMAIPDTLCRMNWWYRTTFAVPAGEKQKRTWLVVNGINYKAEIWLNYQLLGTVEGAFKQEQFDITDLVKKQALQVLGIKIIPPPNPGFPHEQSQAAGAGRNGSSMDLDGPTFISSGGWDWVPGIRDRNIGIWQDVQLRFTGDVSIEYPQVITDLPLPDTTSAAVTINYTVVNHSTTKQEVIANAGINGIELSQKLTLNPGESKLISFSPVTFPQLNITNPKLWWPNGYGDPNLYTTRLTLKQGEKTSDRKDVRFGIREFTYELTVDAPSKPSWRVEYNPIQNIPTGQSIFNNLNRRPVFPEKLESVIEMKRVWIPSIKQDASMVSLSALPDSTLSPFMVMRVNGQRIYCRGGNWGMDDAMKRVSRERLEPYFKLHRDANFTMIRNWTGESTEPVFYELADEYGLLVWNDFWLSKDFQDIDVFDTQLFLDNARDVIRRYRNHASIIIWCARNEGFPLQTLSEGCARLAVEEDGTRHYTPSSRHLNLYKSGPWVYYPNPDQYLSDVEGFNTEIGIPSVPTAESMRAMMAPEDLWPISDAWAYHDFHEQGAWNRQAYRNTINRLFGEAKTVEEFCMRAQVLNFESHHSMYEAWNSRLWNTATGVMLWMTHPAWPSTNWQIYSWDYETLGSYFASKIASEPIHIQKNQVNGKLAIVNTTLSEYKNLNASIKIYSSAGKLLSQKTTSVNLLANQLNETDLLVDEPANSTFLIDLALRDGKGQLISANRYWRSTGGNKRSFQQLVALETIQLSGKVAPSRQKGIIAITLENPAKIPATYIKLNLRNTSNNERILPAYFSDGYFTLLPGETRIIQVSYPESYSGKSVVVTAEGLNTRSSTIGKPVIAP